jgi:hypothetical protein
LQQIFKKRIARRFEDGIVLAVDQRGEYIHIYLPYKMFPSFSPWEVFFFKKKFQAVWFFLGSGLLLLVETCCWYCDDGIHFRTEPP